MVQMSQLQALIEAQKQQSFTTPEEVSDAEALGVLVAHWAEWDGYQIARAFVEALEDANFHYEAAEVAAMFDLEDA